MNKKLTLIFMILFAFIVSCSADEPTEAEVHELTVTAAKGKPVFMRFSEGVTAEDSVNVQGDSKDWHISAEDATWRFSSNSGTRAEALVSGGTGGVKVYKNVKFEDVTSIDHEGGGDWVTDKAYTWTSSGLTKNSNLNYLFTNGLKDGESTSDTYLFRFFLNLQTFKGEYPAGDFIFVIKDGTGGNYVKVQPIELTTDGEDGSSEFENRIYKFKYIMADEDGNFAG